MASPTVPAMDLHSVAELVPAPAAGAHRAGDAWLAGGTFLFSEPHPGVQRLVDLSGFGWPSLVEPGDDADGALRVAATCTVSELAAWAAAAARGQHGALGTGSLRAALLVGQCADAFLAGWKVQGVATVGGNVATALPAAPMVSLLASLDATAVVWGPGGGAREVAVAELVTGDHTTSLAPGELLREAVVPAAALAARTAFRRVSLTPLGRSASLVVGRLDAGGQLVVTVTAAVRAPVQLRWPSLRASGGPQAVAAALDAAVDGSSERTTWHDDVHGHPAWRRAMALRQAGEVVIELSAGPAAAPDGAAA